VSWPILEHEVQVLIGLAEVFTGVFEFVARDWISLRAQARLF
jgi:hypothetical protein